MRIVPTTTATTKPAILPASGPLFWLSELVAVSVAVVVLVAVVVVVVVVVVAAVVGTNVIVDIDAAEYIKRV